MSGYKARDGQVYDSEGKPCWSARTANGRDLEAFDRAAELAKRQRDEKTRETLLRGRHSGSSS